MPNTPSRDRTIVRIQTLSQTLYIGADDSTLTSDPTEARRFTSPEEAREALGRAWKHPAFPSGVEFAFVRVRVAG